MSDRVLLDVDDAEVHPYRLLTALVVPRPIAWISTVSAAGVGNLAPHSFFTVVSASPPMVQFTSVGAKDTLRNVQETGEFVVNVADLPEVDHVNASSARFAPEVDEAEQLGIAMEPSYRVRPPRVAESPAAIECRLHRTLPIGDSTIVIGEVRCFAVRRDVLLDGHPTMARLQPLSRLGRDEWGLPPEVVHLTRPR
ncbi:flavin reductase family protein [Nocardioides daejeonensis]|uniref:flavin reductase family protein n=1 Tax=Nocardioides daejeonensis TaxID=1046556 RepID=UPI000D74DA91|nr:flavin reductase family protein [Nocardioides daejeonensis]